MDQYRQGDVLIVRTISRMIKGKQAARQNGNLVLAEGEATGHAHTISEQDVQMWIAEMEAYLLVESCVLQRDEQGRLHSGEGQAVGYSDGWGVWAWHGVRVPAKVIEAPETLGAAAIQAEPNVEIRRVMIERYGQERYLRESGAQQIHQDDWGTLWRVDIPGDEPLVMVEVVNSTPEPDGSFRNYMLRVPLQMRRAKQAVAWTFGLTEAGYGPAVQT